MRILKKRIHLSTPPRLKFPLVLLLFSTGYEFRVGFCTMGTFDACDRAIAALNGSPNWGYYQGEPLTVEYAKPRSGR